MQLLAAALAGPAGGRSAAVRQLSCKAEEIHTTLRKHLAKEEEQLFPLLLAHFSFAEQTELVAQFLCCIPLAAVEAVLAWLKPAVPQAEQEELLAQARWVGRAYGIWQCRGLPCSSNLKIVLYEIVFWWQRAGAVSW